MSAWFQRQPVARWLLLIMAIFLLAACTPRYLRDGPPDQLLDVTLIEPVNPKPEPLSAYGNHSPYEVMGQTYEVLPTAVGYVEQGRASWYGQAFHGRLTSSGEPYDLYQLTAAHKTLPLPTYVEVRRLDTDQSIIVRVNDRGPFKPGRIIDLSWAAAVKLGMDQVGTAPVEVRALTFDGPPPSIARPARLPVWVQAGAFSNPDNARQLQARLEDAGVGPVAFEAPKTGFSRVWRVRVGPILEATTAIDVVAQLLELGLDQAQYVYP